jgi:hypothetical protein
MFARRVGEHQKTNPTSTPEYDLRFNQTHINAFREKMVFDLASPLLELLENDN